MEKAKGNVMNRYDGERDRFMRDCLQLPIIGSGMEANPDVCLTGPEAERRMGGMILGMMVRMGRRRMAEGASRGQNHHGDVQDRDDPARHLQRWPVLWTDHHTDREPTTERVFSYPIRRRPSTDGYSSMLQCAPIDALFSYDRRSPNPNACEGIAPSHRRSGVDPTVD